MDLRGRKVLIIIPAFNEEESLPRLISGIKRDQPGVDILVVDDGSWDKTSRASARAGVIVLKHPYNLGIGAAMQTGYRYACENGYDIAVQVDGDGQHPPDQIRHILAPVLDGKADLAVGSRFLGAGNYRPTIARAAGIILLSRIVSIITGKRFTDTTSGFRAASRNCIEFFSKSYPDDYPEVESLVLLKRYGYRAMEVPVRMEGRTKGRSSITPLRSIYYMVKVLLAISVDLMKSGAR